MARPRGRPRRWSDHWERFPESVPLPVEDGVATSKQRGAMAEQWWSKRFTEVLDSYGLGARMQRGRRYARQGQVMTLAVDAGLITAQVQGSRRTPYLVSVRLLEVEGGQWEIIERELASRSGLTAALLAGEVPEDLVEVFEAAGTPLLPLRWTDLRASCSCPDAANPCKHLAAVLYVFADQLDADPWLLLQWRGRSRAEVIDLLRTTPSSNESVAPWWPFGPGPLPDEALTASLRPGNRSVSTDGGGEDEDDGDGGGATVLDLLRPTDLAIREMPVVDIIRGAYRAGVATDDQ